MSIISFFRKNSQPVATGGKTLTDFINSSPSEIKKTMKIVVRKANEDQREVVERFNKLQVKQN